MASSRQHFPIDIWLEKLELKIYRSLFEKYEGVEDILWMYERDLKNIGITNGSHRARIGTSLTALREKYDKANKENYGLQSSGSPNMDGTNNMSPCRLDHEKFLSNSPSNHLNINATQSGARSWPSSASSTSYNTKQSSPRRSMEGNLNTEATAEDLKRALERELSLDSSDFRSYAWYHGTILRQRAEDIVVNDGDFLVRDCISQPGDYVITCKWKNIPLHFIIKKIFLQRDTVYEKIQYCFENESFDSIPDFVTYYVGSKCPLSNSSGAIISHPINRTMPLTYYASRYGVQCQIHYVAKALENIPSTPLSTKSSPSRSPRPISDDYPKSIEKTSLSKVLILNEDSIPTKPPVPNKPLQSIVSQRTNLTRVNSDPTLSPNTERRIIQTRPNSGCFSSESAKENSLRIDDKPPPKPSRVPSRRCAQRPLLLKRMRNVSTNSDDGDISPKCVPVPRSSIVHSLHFKRQMSGETRFSFLDRPSLSDELDVEQTVPVLFSMPSLNPPSTFNVFKFRTPLLDPENKPLESNVLEKVKTVLLSETSNVIACHLTRIDMEVAKNCQDVDLGLGVSNGLELICLPQGEQLRKDLIERIECMKLFVAITILTSTEETERVELLNKWINIAMEIKTALGNFYGFASIMLGLTIPEIAQLESTWLALRSTYTENAFTFETKLRPFLKALQETSTLDAPNTCIPYILSLIIILQKHLSVTKVMEEEFSNEQIINQTVSNFNLPGDQNTSDFGLQLLEDHLEVGRHMIQHISVLQQNGETSLKNIKYQHMLLDMLCTEFHLKMLWGSRGATVSPEERYQKFERVLALLHERCR